MRLLSIVLILFAFPACAGDAPDAGRDIHVDLDEVIAAGVATPIDGVTSSGQPDEAALQVFADSGYVAVIDLRGEKEDRGVEDFPGAVESKGMSYIPFPIVGANALNFENAAKLDAILADIDGPVLVHCGSGNRVGALLALREAVNGASDEEALALGKDAGLTRLEPRVREVLESDN